LVKELEGEVLDLGMGGAPPAEAEHAALDDRPGFAFRSARARRPVQWMAMLRIGLIVAIVAGALAAGLYYVGVLITAQIDRVLGS
jgi:hypothetical protein